MDSEKFYSLARQNILPIALGIIGVALLFAGIFQFYLNKSKEESPLVFEEANEEVKTEIIVVDVEGAVINPGVYKISSDSRVVDALASAGGLSEEADRQWVEKNINLAKKVTDGLKIYIPRTGEEILSQNSSGEIDSGTGGPVININSASQSDLESLPGIGAVTAGKIIEGRPYSDIEDLQSKKIVGSATYEKIKDKISAN